MDEYQFVVQWVLALAPAERARVLDFGCGRGTTVGRLRAAGVDAMGCDLYSDGRDASILQTELGRAALRRMPEGRIPFPDESFDCVASNMVFEHVQEIDLALAEIHRVLRPGGRLLTLFPDRGVWREGHVGVAFMHWFAPQSRLRTAYGTMARSLGFGHNKGTKSPLQWARDAGEYLDRWTVYRSPSEVRRAFDARFVDRRHIEAQWLRCRLGRRARTVAMVPDAALALLTRRTCTLAFECRKA